MKKLKKHLKLLLTIAGLGGLIALTYPKLELIFAFTGEVDPRTIFYAYDPKTAITPPTATGEPAAAVPILMYHGVVSAVDPENTDQFHFIAQMEMLKKNGYQTISLADMEAWRAGTFVLPHKPIIITFDDGRRDSYFSTDEIFKKLGFKATIFEVSGKANTNNKFYLSWPELQQMEKSGHWDVEAHGQFSHDKIKIDANGNIGRFLTSKIYLPAGRLETDEEFKKRVEGDYTNNITDLQNNLHITPRYFAIPLNDYGEKSVSNYPGATQFNIGLIAKYFKMAFIQVNDSNDVTIFHGNVYNYKDDDPLFTKRIEVKNMDPEFLRTLLESQYPSPPNLSWQPGTLNSLRGWTFDEYGTHWFDSVGMHLTSDYQNSASAAFFGETHWTNYTLRANVQKKAGRSLVIIGYAKDKYNYVFAGVSSYGYYLSELRDGKEYQLAPVVPIATSTKPVTFYLQFKNNSVSVLANNRLLFSNVKVDFDRGAFGFKVWDTKGNAEGLVSEIDIEPTL